MFKLIIYTIKFKATNDKKCATAAFGVTSCLLWNIDETNACFSATGRYFSFDEEKVELGIKFIINNIYRKLSIQNTIRYFVKSKVKFPVFFHESFLYFIIFSTIINKKFLKGCVAIQSLQGK